jgi:dienelactone hydrolase
MRQRTDTKHRFFRSLQAAGLLCAGALLSAAAWAQTSFTDTYNGASSSGGDCSSTYNIVGMEPTTPGKHPVFVYMVGTWENYTNASAMEAVKRMAAKGYVAATVEYGNSAFGNCNIIGAKSKCVFDPNSAVSAISQICSRKSADCHKGMVVAGFSQGAIMSILAKNYDARVQAAYGLGAGVQYASTDLRQCIANGNRVLPSDRLRIVNGETDEFMGGTPITVRSQMQEVTGLDCGPTAYSCFNSNKSGWVMVQQIEMESGLADHCYMRSAGCGTSQEVLNPGWQSGSKDWQLEANLQWLTNFTGK